jgi:hypothetical protein
MWRRTQIVLLGVGIACIITGVYTIISPPNLQFYAKDFNVDIELLKIIFYKGMCLGGTTTAVLFLGLICVVKSIQSKN